MKDRKILYDDFKNTFLFLCWSLYYSLIIVINLVLYDKFDKIFNMINNLLCLLYVFDKRTPNQLTRICLLILTTKILPSIIPDLIPEFVTIFVQFSISLVICMILVTISYLLNKND